MLSVDEINLTIVQKASLIRRVTENFMHTGEGEEGFLLVKSGNPVISIGGLSCVSRPFDLFVFHTNEDHGWSGEGEVIVFHGRFHGVYRK